VTGPVQWVVVQIRLGRKHQQLRQQGIQKKAPAAESPRVLEAGSPTLIGETLPLEVINCKAKWKIPA